MAKGKEAAFTNQVRSLARDLGWLEMHPYRSDRSTPGYPDLTLARAPWVITAELKLDDKRSKLSPAQEVWKYELEQCDKHEYHLWRPSNLDDIAKILYETR